MNLDQIIAKEIDDHLTLLKGVMAELGGPIENACNMAIQAIQAGHKIIIFGNGGSAADAQHIAAELSGRFRRERRGLAALALTTDTSALTAISNDYGYESVFSRQVEALANEGDLLIGISTSGNSANVVNALQLGSKAGCRTLGLTGGSGGKMKELCEACICIPSNDTPRIQEMHIMIGHIICEAVELSVC